MGEKHVALGREGFELSTSSDRALISAATASGALFGVYRTLSFFQHGEPLASSVQKPAMELRVWDLWDNLAGDIERGYGGGSLIWPYAAWDLARPPRPTKLFLTACDASDPYQRWSGAAFGSPGTASTVVNGGGSECVSDTSQNPASLAPCSASSPKLVLNGTADAGQLAVASGERTGTCLDVNRGAGPEVVLWRCHSPQDTDYRHQRFQRVDDTLRWGGRCLAALNAAPQPDNLPSPLAPGVYAARVSAMLRLLKAAGVNGLALSNVNSCGRASGDRTPFTSGAHPSRRCRLLGLESHSAKYISGAGGVETPFPLQTVPP